MSLNPMLGHLYHDYSISNSYTVLDAKEKMKTREINARESKFLEKYTDVLDKAKQICQRKNEWEQRNIRKQLDSINMKTMSLDKGLKKESQRLKLFDDVLNNTNSERNSRPTTVASSKRLRRRNFISDRSLYSNISSENRISQKQNINDGESERRNNSNSETTLSRTEKLIKKADHVTKSLHKLYTKNFEKRWKNVNGIMIEVLASESNEELERALFVLRGTQAGNLIENILLEREMSKQKHSESHERGGSVSSVSSDGASPEAVFITELNVKDGTEKLKRVSEHRVSTPTSEKETKDLFKVKGTCVSDEARQVKYLHEDIEKIDDEENSLPEIGANATCDHITSDDDEKEVTAKTYNANMPTRDASSETESLETSDINYTFSNGMREEPRKWISVADVHLDLNNIFERDDPKLMSSTIVNPSEHEYKPLLKWREIFKTPEVWKQNRKTVQRIKRPKAVSLVKVHGQYRQTMLNIHELMKTVGGAKIP